MQQMQPIQVALKPKSGKTTIVDKMRLEQIFSFNYLPHLEFASYKVEKYLKKQCKKALKKGRIATVTRWLGRFHKEALLNHEIPNVTIKWVDEQVGYGVFANAPFAPWHVVGEYAGLLRRRALFTPNINDYCFMYPREWLSLKAFTIDSEKQGNFTRFINHSDNPNCESISVYFDGVFRILFRTVRPIAPDEELTYDYGDIYWRRRKKVLL